MQSIRHIITSLLLMTAFSAISLYAEEVPSINVEFENTPLFSEANFLPGTQVVRFVKVTNNGTLEQPIHVETLNENQTNNLAQAINLFIKENNETLWSGTLDDFFDAGKINLSLVSPQETIQYNFEAVFNPLSGNEYQNATIQFDLVVGFQGGSFTDDTPTNEGGSTESGNNRTATQSATGGGGGGGGTEFTQLIITNQNIETANNTADINWTTNLISTSQIVYGPANTLYSLNLNAPHFGYPSGTIQDNTLDTHHIQTISNLPFGTYRFRVVSKSLPHGLPTIGNEGLFTLGESTQNNFPVQAFFQDIPPVTNSTKSNENTDEDTEGLDPNTNSNKNNQFVIATEQTNLPRPNESNLASAFFTLPDLFQDNFDCIAYALTLLILLSVIWILLSKRYTHLTPTQIASRKFIFFLRTSIALIATAIFFDWCILWPFIIISTVFVFGLLLRLRG